MTLEALAWDDSESALRLLDQTLLPETTHYRAITEVDELVRSIVDLAVRGAPALGVAGAFGVVIAVDQAIREGWSDAELDHAIERIANARPTAVNLAWGVEQLRPLLSQSREALLAAAKRFTPKTLQPTASSLGSEPTGSKSS